LEEARLAIMSGFAVESGGVNVCDFDVQEVLEMIYHWHLPAESKLRYVVEDSKNSFPPALDVPEPKMGQHIELQLPDSDPRAVAYVAGSAPKPGATLPMAPAGVLEADKGHQL
jgi:hypothetical protein